MKNYPKYKDSQIGWLGKIPEHWEVKKTKYLFDITKRISGELGHDILSITQKGIKIKDTESGEGQLSMDYSKYQIVDKGDFGMNHMDLLTGFVDISKFDGVMSPDYRVFKLKDKDSDPRYMLYLFQKGYWGKLFFPLGQGSSELGRWRLPADQFKLFQLPVPPKQEQIVIADFLYNHTSKIKNLIDLKEKSIELLKERKKAIINQAVTKGLDSNAEMKDSGFEWLGDIPSNWEIHKIGFVTKKVSIKGIKNPVLLSVERERGIILRSDSVGNHNVIPDDLSGYKLVEKGNLVLNKMKTWQGSLGVSKYNGVVSPAYIVLKINATFDINFMHHLLRCKAYVNEYNRISYGVRPDQWDMHFEDFKQIPMLIPSEVEQMKIVKHIEIKSEEIANSIAQAKQEIKLIKEYQQSLISDVVTGKIDVRDK